MRHLLLLRHATAEPGRGAPDVERPLTPDGVAEAQGVGRDVAGAPVDLILSSDARRAMETAEALGLATPLSAERELYQASSEDMLERIRQVGDEVGGLLVVGHNPAVQQLAHALLAAPTDRERVAARFSPASLAVLAIEERWEALRGACATLVRLRHPDGAG